MKCQNCGAENDDQNKFCESCGSVLASPEKSFSQDPDAGNSYGYGTMRQNGGYRQGMPNQNGGYQQGMPNQNGGYRQGMSNQNGGYQQGMPNRNYGYAAGTNMPLKPMKKRGNGFGIASLVCGIVAFVFCWIFIPAWILGPLALVFGIIQCCTRRSKGMGIAGSVLGAAAVILSIIIFAAVTDDTEMTGTTGIEKSDGYEVNRNKDTDGNDKTSDKEVSRTADTVKDTYSGSEVFEGIGSFCISDEWIFDAESSSDDLYIYVPAGVDTQYVSDLVIAQAFTTKYSFSDKDELIQINKQDVAEQYGVSQNDVKVYINDDLTVPIIAYEFDAYDDELELRIKVTEYHAVGDGLIAIFSSIDYVDWEDGQLSAKECAYEAAKAFVFE